MILHHSNKHLQLLAIITIVFLGILLPVIIFMIYRKIRKNLKDQELEDALNGKTHKIFSKIINIYFLALLRRVINLNPDNFESIINDYIEVSEININASEEEEENTSMYLRLEFNELFLTIEVCNILYHNIYRIDNIYALKYFNKKDILLIDST